MLSPLAPVQAQTPPLLWSTNIGARVFAADSSSTVYATAGGAVIELTSAGAVQATNAMCPLPGLALRDSLGNFYFCGTFPFHGTGTTVTPVDFGGITLTNGMCYLAKYDASGSLLWAKEFGPQMSTFLRRVAVTDIQLGPTNDVFIGYIDAESTSSFYSLVAHCDSSGVITWTTALANGSTAPGPFGSTSGSVRLMAQAGSSLYASVYDTGNNSYPPENFYLLSGAGAATQIATMGSQGSAWNYARTVTDSVGNIFNVEAGQLTKRTPGGGILWNYGVGGRWTLAADGLNGVLVSDDSGAFSRFDPDGNPVWTLSLDSPANAIVLDAQGNRFVSLANGVVARIGAEPLSPPQLTNSPPNLTVLAGSDLALTVGASGLSPLRYTWLFNNSELPGATNSTLTISQATKAQAGLYSVVVTNFAGSITSSPALVRVKQVEFFLTNQVLAATNYFFNTPPTLTLRSAFTNGSLFYTLDGSAPSFNSASYTGPFRLAQTALVRAIGYSADFSHSEEADPVNATLLAQHSLAVTSTGGGTVGLNPPGGTYANTNLVTITATPRSGWSFLYWTGDDSGTNPVLTVSLERDKSFQAVFGTTLATTVVGNGEISLNPPGGTYPYGTVVRLTAIPQAGNYFGAWGNAASGNINPLYFSLTNPSPTVSSIFGQLGFGQFSLYVTISGHGRVSASPQANFYTTGQSVSLTATPDAGQRFLGWSGDASGTDNPLTVSMSQSRTVNAQFTSAALVRVSAPDGDGPTAAGFRFSIDADPLTSWQVFGSTDLSSWLSLGTVTNRSTEVHFIDTGSAGLAKRFYKVLPWP